MSNGPELADEKRAQDIELYAALLTFIMQRLSYVDESLTCARRRVDMEACALQVRMSLEHLVLASLVANRPAASQVASAFQAHDAARARKIVRRVNENYWPIPFDKKPSVDTSGRPTFQMGEPESRYLVEAEWGEAFGFCSSLLHAPNPYRYLHERVDEFDQQIARLSSLSSLTQRLLLRHQIYLSEADVSLVCEVPTDLDVRPSVLVYARVPRRR